jgi:SPP1 family predicted phage head-tail adaptor
MKAGELRNPITFEQPVKQKDALGNPVATYVTVDPPDWAAIEELSGRALELAQQLDETISHKVTIRWRHDVNKKMRVVFKGRYLNIVVALNVKERDQELWLMCEEA